MQAIKRGLILAALFAAVGLVLSQLFDTKIADGAERRRILPQQFFPKAEQPEYVVKVRAEITERRETHRGTGTFIRNDLVITNHHVVRGLGDKILDDNVVTVEVKGGKRLKGKVTKYDAEDDFALVKLDEPYDVKPVTLAEEAPERGDVIRIGGFPADGLVPGVRPDAYYEVEGEVNGFAAVTRNRDRDSVFHVNKRTFSGMSGSGAFNENGELAGVLWGSLANARCSDVVALRNFLEGSDYTNAPAPVPDGVKVFK